MCLPSHLRCCDKVALMAACAIAQFTCDQAVHSAESPTIQVTIDSLSTIDTITSAQLGGARAHINFPYLKQHSNGDLIANYTLGQTQGGSQFGRQAVSVDGGQTWTIRASQVNGDGVQASLIRPAGQMSRGWGVSASNSAGFTTFSNSRYNSSNGGLSWDNGFEDAFYNTGGVSYSFMYGNLSDVVDSSGTLYMTLYGTRTGNSKNESVLFTSTDDGKNWTRRSTIAAYTSSLSLGQMGIEGPSETSLVKLDNGDLLAVFRTGQPFPNSQIDAFGPALFSSISHDNGFTWTAAKSLGVGGVMPIMRKLDDGSVALTYGRYGAKVMFADNTGTRWTTPTVIYNGPGSGHTEMRRNADGKYVYVYDQSGFYPPSWNASPPPAYVYNNDQSANLRVATLNIQHQPTSDSYIWSTEYHGDAVPTSIGQGWTSAQTGTPTTRLLAELGQDYLSINSGSTGSDNSLSYAIGGAAGTTWAGIDFSQGAVLEIRARAGSPGTAEGSASIYLGDGSHGAITLELDGDSVNLEGLGGAAGQVEYRTTDHPTFSPTTMHNYRLTIQPQASLGSTILAQLYLDGDDANAILAQQLSSGGVDEIRFGDLVGTNNGVFDLDYLRFASLPHVALAGDYNADGIVDESDYVMWRKDLGTGNSLPNDTTPGSIAIEDYRTWRSNFGRTIGSGTAAAKEVPEPSGLISVISIMAFGMATWRRPSSSLRLQLSNQSRF